MAQYYMLNNINFMKFFNTYHICYEKYFAYLNSLYILLLVKYIWTIITLNNNTSNITFFN